MSLLDYAGRFHPVLVHLPIGILLVAVFFEWLSRRKGFRKLRKSVRPLLFLGFISALLSGITGYLLSRSGDYDPELLNLHQWLGIVVTTLSLIVFVLREFKSREIRLAYGIFMVMLALLIVLTGHAGGRLTHGEEFLKFPDEISWREVTSPKRTLYTNLSTALIYKDIVAPILNEKCKQCHGPSRQKGKLRLDKPEFILKGGKSGKAIGAEGEIFTRIHLERSDDDHMPPKEKKQLDASEIILLSYWLETGPDFTSKFSALPKSDSIANVLRGMGNQPQEAPEEIIAAPDERAIKNLQKAGIVVSFQSLNNGAVTLNLTHLDSAKLAATLPDVLKISPQVIDLRLNGSKLSHAGWASLASLTAIRKLNLANSNVEDADLSVLQKLSSLKYLNLIGTRVTLAGMQKLSLPQISHLFVYQTAIGPTDAAILRRIFPAAVVEFGNYQVTTLASDTLLVTKPYEVPK